MVTRQGVGAFVADQVRRPFRVDFDETSPLRERAQRHGTAHRRRNRGRRACRRTRLGGPVKKIADRFAAIRAAIDHGDNAVDQDFAFHCEIADATGNPQFKRFLEYLGRFIIPRRTVWGSLGAADQSQPSRSLPAASTSKSCMRSATHAVTQARDAMQRHLLNSRDRYEKLAAEIGIK